MRIERGSSIFIKRCRFIVRRFKRLSRFKIFSIRRSVLTCYLVLRWSLVLIWRLVFIWFVVLKWRLVFI